MRILIDICHPAHINFFKIVAERLKNEGHEILITVLKRGKLPSIAEDVFYGFNVKIINKHRGTRWSIIFEANILKFFILLKICFQFKPDIGLSAGSFILGAVLKLYNKPNIQFDDDPERKINVFLEKITSTKLYFPIFYNKEKNNIKIYNSLKEWAYLSPEYFNENDSVLSTYEIKSKEYIFIREISTGSLNYLGQKVGIIASIAKSLPPGIKIVMSLEDKTKINQYPSNWIILNEPVKDLHSLIYYSKLLISSGDSMAREAAILGVPSIYCGKRIMAANEVLIREGMLFHLKIEDVPIVVNNIINGKIQIQNQEKFRFFLKNRWDDVNKIIMEEIHCIGKETI